MSCCRLKFTALSITAIAFALLAAQHVFPQSDAAALRRTLKEEAGFTAADLEALDRTEIVVKVLETGDKQEVATLGAVRLKGISAVSMQQFRAALDQKKNDAVATKGKFSLPPVLSDIEALKVTDKDLKELRSCRVRSCDLNMSAEWIERFSAEGPTADRFKEMLVDYAARYSAKGIGGMGEFNNRKKVVLLEQSHKRLLGEMPFLRQFEPGLYDYLLEYPGRELPGVDSDLHWSSVDFGLDPTIAFTHTAAFTGERGSQFLAARQFYSTRYLDASLTLTMLLSFPGEPDSYLIFTDRSRSDALDGMFHSIASGVVENQAAERVKEVLRSAELRLIAANQPAEPANEGSGDGLPAGYLIAALAAILAAVAAYFLLRRRLS